MDFAKNRGVSYQEEAKAAFFSNSQITMLLRTPISASHALFPCSEPKEFLDIGISARERSAKGPLDLYCHVLFCLKTSIMIFIQ
jgi:hypothetical protein